MAMTVKRTMTTAMATTVVGNYEGYGDGGKSDGKVDEGGWQATGTGAMVMRVAGKGR